VISALTILLVIAGLHFAASICTQLIGFFKTGSAFREDGATNTASRTSSPAAVPASGSTQQGAVPRLLYDAAAYIPDPALAGNYAISQQIPQGFDAMDDDVATSAPAPEPAMQPSSLNTVPAQRSQVLINQAPQQPLEHHEPSITRPKPQFCPHCGNPLMVDPSTSRCEYCGEKVFLG
jgi:hypothetical protein